MFLEKFIMRPRHIEVQLMGDKHGNLVHLYERDCSLQRRHQKVVEIAPSANLDPQLRDAICEAAIKIGKEVNYVAAGTVEFLVDTETGKFYFIEVNPRVQVEHTVTEVVTGIDIVRTQILVSEGYKLSDPEINIPNQASISTRGFAMQCRVTTEDPENKFLPDYGKIAHYRSAAGMGVRLDAGTAFSGAIVTPFYDSLLVKVIASGRTFIDAARRMERVLQEFRVRGVKTNIPFLINLVTHPKFLEGGFTTRFMDETPELFHFTPRRDRATKLLRYLGNVAVNGHPLVKQKPKHVRREPAPLPNLEGKPTPPGTKQKLKELGPTKFSKWILDQKPLLLTDTTFRDAHQSLLATRMRTYDMLGIAEAYAKLVPNLFSIEMWGGATFDTTMRFLKECPWQRLTELRERIPNILFQMLFRASNALGYSNYPDNVIRAFVKESADAGMDLFRIFDSLNWLPNMRVAMEAVLETDTLCEAVICYTGDVLDKKKTKYDLKYYVDMAKELEKMGAHILCIKDMAGLCKPYAAELLVKTLKQEIGIPIHFHTHDTSGVQATSILKAAEVDLDIADCAMGPLSGLTSQPNLGSVVQSLRFTPRDTGLCPDNVQSLDEYWEAVREYYVPFESNMKASTADVYRNEMPGGQYTNLYEQAQAVGLESKWHQICRVYAEVNDLFGDIVKVTPSSKAVGDMALFLVANNLRTDEVLDSNRELAFPESVIDLISGRMGQPPGGFPQKVVDRILRGQKQVEGRPGDSLPPVDLAAVAEKLKGSLENPPTQRDVLSHVMFPRVFSELTTHQDNYADTSILSTPLFFYGPAQAEEMALDIEKGKRLIVKFLNIGDAQPDGTRTVSFELNGQPRDVTVRDESVEADVSAKRKADTANPNHVGAPMPGMVVTVAVKAGDAAKKGQKLVTMEAMKMETTLYAERDGKVAEVLVAPGSRVDSGELLVVWE